MALTQKWANIDRVYDRLIKKIVCSARRNGCYRPIGITDQEWVILRIMVKCGSLLEHGQDLYPTVNTPSCISQAAWEHHLDEYAPIVEEVLREKNRGDGEE